MAIYLLDNLSYSFYNRWAWIKNVPASVNSFEVSLVRAEISDALCLSSTARATVTENQTRNCEMIGIF